MQGCPELVEAISCCIRPSASTKLLVRFCRLSCKVFLRAVLLSTISLSGEGQAFHPFQEDQGRQNRRWGILLPVTGLGAVPLGHTTGQTSWYSIQFKLNSRCTVLQVLGEVKLRLCKMLLLSPFTAFNHRYYCVQMCLHSLFPKWA